jgi:branched-chain amino acid aminotransferase
MAELMVYLNGKLVPESQATISINDSGFTLGDTVYEAARTFGGVLFKLDEHLERLYRSLAYVRIDAGLTPVELDAVVRQVVEYNRPVIGNDFWVYIYISRGLYVDNIRHYLPATLEERPPTVVVAAKRLPFASFAHGYRHGVHAVTPSTRHTPTQCLDPKLKTCSRMHLVLAEYEAKQVDVKAWSMILDVNGNITENKSGNVFVIKGGELYTPRAISALAGVTRGTVIEIAGKLGIPVHETDLQPYHAITADEAFFTSTGYCIMPIVKVNNVPLGDGAPGPVVRQLLAGWSQHVNFDIVAQAEKVLASS